MAFVSSECFSAHIRLMPSNALLSKLKQSAHYSRSAAKSRRPTHLLTRSCAWEFSISVAVVIAFIICYAPFHVQRLITSRLNVFHLTLRQQRALSIFYFISGILYYIGSTVNPIFYHLFSRKYRVACVRTMKRLMHFRWRRSPTKTKQPSTARPVLYIDHNGKLQRTESIFRKPQRAKTSLDLVNNKPHLFRLAMPGFAAHRTR